jgi:uncharacterized membrane protein YuzA (DUF378 family)
MAFNHPSTDSNPRNIVGSARGASLSPPMGAPGWLSMILMIIGSLNWGLVGLFNVDLVASIFGPLTMASRVVYVLVGIAALYGIFLLVRLGQRRTLAA